MQQTETSTPKTQTTLTKKKRRKDKISKTKEARTALCISKGKTSRQHETSERTVVTI